MPDIQKVVDTLLKQATEVFDSGDALRFSQAALNAAHVKHALNPPARQCSCGKSNG
jgi:hypothetical protein